MSAEERNKKNQERMSSYAADAKSAERDGNGGIQIPSGQRLGDKVLVFEDVSKKYDGAALLEGCSFVLPRNAVVGVIGPNGIGKTTLFRMITGQERPDGGRITVGESVAIAYVDQERDSLDGNKTIFEEIAEGKDRMEVGGISMSSRAYIWKFNFKDAQQQKKVCACSGGELNRIHLAKMLRRGGNLLLLDEPTNDLDVDTMRVLEQAIIDFQGCAMVISHDRFFLDRICTHLLVFEGNGRTQWFQGNFAAYEERVRAENPERLAHRRSKYKKLQLR